MNKDLVSRFTVCVLCPLLIIIAGCGRTQMARFYTLSALVEPETGRQETPSGHGVAVGLGPIQFPAYLDRPQIVTRVSQDEVRFAEYHRWAGPLAGSFSSVLAENLSNLLGTDRIAQYPWRSTTPIDWRVEIDVSRFEGSPGGSVVLQSQWTIFSKDRKRALVRKTSTLSEPVNGQGYEALVSAQSRALGALSRQIAQAIRTLPQGAQEE